MSRLQAPVTVQDHVRGGPLGRVTLVEYGDYRCPRCAVTHRVLCLLEDSFGETLSVVYRHYPMAEAHPVTQATAEAAEFAGDHGRFWEMHDAIFANQERLCVPLLVMLADTLGLSRVELLDSLERMAHGEKIQADFVGGRDSGVEGTPCIFVNGRRHQPGLTLAASITAAMVIGGAVLGSPASEDASARLPEASGSLS
jgi:protein-disulfide isomerase